MKQLGQLIIDNEDWLVDRVVHYAVTEGYSEFTSTLREAWRASICGLSAPLLESIRAADDGSGAGLAREGLVAFGVEQALRHRDRGVRLQDFLGLMKYYRRAYLDLIDERAHGPSDRRKLRGYVLDFFDHVEVGLCGAWNASSDGDRLHELQDKNKRLTNEKNKYLTIFESIREPVILLDAGGAPVHLNDAAHRLFCGEVAPGASYYGALCSPLLNSQISEILKARGDSSDDLSIETLAGTREFNVKIQRMLDISQKFGGTVIILNDVSEYKRALRQARAADHAKSTFLAAMSHEIRTPIAGALGLARLLRETPLSQDQAHLVEGIISSADLLSGVVGDILDFSQAEVGAHPPVPRDFEVENLIRQVLMIVEPLAAEKRIALVTEVSPAIPARLNGDASMIRQVLLNLIHNAIKYTDVGSVAVAVRGVEDPGSDRLRVRFEVRDTGVGLPAGPTERLFDAFSQGHMAKGGLGLGLAICRKIVQRMEGEIGCHPGEGGGSVFFIELLLAQAQEAAEATDPPAVTRSARILVVDDDAVSRLVAEGFASRLGHAPRSVASAAEALNLLEVERFDLVLSDNRMPGITGLELVQRIRALTGGPNAGIPVVLATASADDIRTQGDLATHPDGFLAKPYDATDLAREVARHLPDSTVPPPEPAIEPARDGIDLSVAEAHIANLGRERGCRVIQAFLESAPRHVDAMQAGLSRRDPAATATAAHSLAGASSLLGLRTLEGLAREIESRAADPAFPVAAADVAAIRDVVADVARALGEVCQPAF